MERETENRFDAARRGFLRAGLGVATALGLVLRADARPTRAVRRAEADDGDVVEIQLGPIPALEPAREGTLRPPVPISFGPFYRARAPFRGKLSVLGEPGTPFVLCGRVWDLETRRPLPGAVLDFWHVDAHERYSDGIEDMRNRGRLISSETGAYELESVRPIPYRPSRAENPAFWRCGHFHLLVRAPGFAPLVTELHFADEEHEEDPMYEPANAMTVEDREHGGVRYQTAVFDLVLRRS